MHPKHLHNTTNSVEEQLTYSITISNCAHPYIDLRFEGLSKDQAAGICTVAIKSFRQFEVVCEQTGEVCYNRYVATDWHVPSMTYSEAIAAMFRIAEHG